MTTKKYFHQNLIETSNEYNYEWTLHNFSVCCYNRVVESQIISNYVPGYQSELKWILKLYPDGIYEDCKGYISVFLESRNDFEVTLDSRQITISDNLETHVSLRLEDNYTYKEYGICRGFDCCLKRSVLNDLKKGGDILKVTLTMTYHKKSTNSQRNLIVGLELLFKSEENSDIVLISKDGKEHKAHKTILMFRSKVFSAMFQHDMKENVENKVKIEDVDNDTLRKMLYFIYTGEIQNIDKNTEKLLIVADKYELNDMKKMCTDYMCENITVDNVLDLIEFSDTYSICELEKKAKDYFLKNHKEVMSVKGLETVRQLSRNILNDLFYELTTK